MIIFKPMLCSLKLHRRWFAEVIKTRVINGLFACDNARIIIFSTYGKNFQDGQCNSRHWKDIFSCLFEKYFRYYNCQVELNWPWFPHMVRLCCLCNKTLIADRFFALFHVVWISRFTWFDYYSSFLSSLQRLKEFVRATGSRHSKVSRFLYILIQKKGEEIFTI